MIDEQTARRVADELNSMSADPGMRVVVDYDGTVGDTLYSGNSFPALADDQVMMLKPWADERVTPPRRDVRVR